MTYCDKCNQKITGLTWLLWEDNWSGLFCQTDARVISGSSMELTQNNAAQEIMEIIGQHPDRAREFALLGLRFLKDGFDQEYTAAQEFYQKYPWIFREAK